MLNLKIFENIRKIQSDYTELKKNIANLQEETKLNRNLQQIYALRLLRKLPLNYDMIIQGVGYADLSPKEAYKLYLDENLLFNFIDVSDQSYLPVKKIEHSIHIPFEHLESRFSEMTPKSKIIFVISEDGTKSILASEFFIRKGYLLVNNISGGHQYWPGHKTEPQV